MSMDHWSSVISSTWHIYKICLSHILARMSFSSQTTAVPTECWLVEHYLECYPRWILVEVMQSVSWQISFSEDDDLLKEVRTRLLKAAIHTEQQSLLRAR